MVRYDSEYEIQMRAAHASRSHEEMDSSGLNNTLPLQRWRTEQHLALAEMQGCRIQNLRTPPLALRGHHYRLRRVTPFVAFLQASSLTK